MKPQLRAFSLNFFFHFYSTVIILQQSTLTLTYTGTQHTDARNLVTNYQFNDEKVLVGRQRTKNDISEPSNNIRTSAKSGATLERAWAIRPRDVFLKFNK